METLNASFASPVADAATAKIQMPVEGLLGHLLNGMSAWSILATVFLLLVTYDQCEYLQHKQAQPTLTVISELPLPKRFH